LVSGEKIQFSSKNVNQDPIRIQIRNYYCRSGFRKYFRIRRSEPVGGEDSPLGKTPLALVAGVRPRLLMHEPDVIAEIARDFRRVGTQVAGQRGLRRVDEPVLLQIAQAPASKEQCSGSEIINYGSGSLN